MPGSALALVLWPLLATLAIPAEGQLPQPPALPRPAISTYVPQVADLEKAEHFYHQLLGLEAALGDPRARFAWFPVSPFLRDMYGVDGQTRNFTVRIPRSDLQIEPIQWKEAKGKPLQPKLQDVGATRLILDVSDIGVLVDRLKRGGARSITAGGKPLALRDAGGTSQAMLFEDSNGFFVELVQRPTLPPRAGDGGPLPYIYGGTVVATVANIERSAQFFRDVLGLPVTIDPAFHSDAARLQILGLQGAQYREASVTWPADTPHLHLVEYEGLDRRTLTPLVADPNAVVMRTNVRSIDDILEKLRGFPDATVMNLAGVPFLNGRNRWLIVRVPGASTYVQMIGPTPSPTP